MRCCSAVSSEYRLSNGTVPPMTISRLIVEPVLGSSCLIEYLAGWERSPAAGFAWQAFETTATAMTAERIASPGTGGLNMTSALGPSPHPTPVPWKQLAPRGLPSASAAD